MFERKRQMNTIRFDKKNVRMVAHRGVSGLEKENTLPAFVAAGNRSYFGVETDVHRTLDGKFVVIHDDSTARVGPTNLPVEQTCFQKLRDLYLTDIDGAVGRCDLRIPTLEEYIRICKKYDKTCVLELKNQFSEEDVGRIVRIIEGEGWIDRVIFISFCFDNLVYVRKFRSEQTVQFLFAELTEDIFAGLVEHRFDVDIHYPHLTKEMVDRFHAVGIRVNCWTCDKPEDAERLADWGVDFITSNILE